MSGTEDAGECISSQLTYWKQNDLIGQASLNLNGKAGQQQGWEGWKERELLCAQARSSAMASSCGHLPLVLPGKGRGPSRTAVVLEMSLCHPGATLYACKQGAGLSGST